MIIYLLKLKIIDAFLALNFIVNNLLFNFLFKYYSKCYRIN